MPALTDEDKVLRNDTGKRIAAAIENLARPSADDISYDNTESGLTAENTQDAIDELTKMIESADTLEELTDVNIQNKQNQDTLEYDSSSSKWKNVSRILEKSGSGSLVSFSDGGDNIPLGSLIANITTVQSGSGTPSPSNVRAISGWSECNVSRTGKNLLDPKDNFPLTGTLSSEYYRQIQPNVAGTGKIGFSHLELGKTYTFSCNITTDILPFSVSVGAGNGTYLTDVATQSYNASGKVSITFTVTTDKLVNGDVFCFRAPRYSSATNANFTISDIMLELSDTATTYEPYQGIQITLPFGQTVYGGTLNVLTGLLTVTHGYVSDMSALSWSGLDTNGIFYASISNIKIPSSASERKTGIICSIYPVSSGTSINASMDDKSMLRHNGSLYIRDTTYSDATTFTNSLSGKQFVYELATPTTIQLTPIQVRTLLGLNNIFADTGDVSLSYFTQNAKPISDLSDANKQDVLATDVPKTDLTDIFVTGSTNNSGSNIAAGAYFYKDGKIAYCKSAISANAPLTLGTNYELVTAGALNKIMSAIGSKLDSANPTGTGSLSLNRTGTVGTQSVTLCRDCEASGPYSLAEGYATKSKANSSHSEGYETEASGNMSHSEGMGTIAKYKAQHVFGEYNIADPVIANPANRGTYIEIVGKGTADNNRSNARTLDWSGNEVLAGDLTIMGNKSVNDAITVQTPTNITLTLQSGINLSIESMTVKRISKLNIINLTLLTSATLNASTEIFVGIFSNILTGYGYVCGSMVTASDTKEQGAFNVNTANGRLYICPTNSIPSGYKLSMSIYLLSA